MMMAAANKISPVSFLATLLRILPKALFTRSIFGLLSFASLCRVVSADRRPYSLLF